MLKKGKWLALKGCKLMDLICSPRQENKILVKTRQTTKAMIPKQVFIEVTHRCNLKCVHCYLEGSCVNELSTHEFQNILDQFSDLGVFFIGFTGGVGARSGAQTASA